MKNSFGNNVPIINLYKKSNFKSKIDTQLLYGDNFKIKKRLKNFSKIKIKKYNDHKQILMNFDAILNENEIQSISGDKFVKNFSVKKEGKENQLSALAKFNNLKEQESFLKKWNNKIKNYDISLDEID